MQTLNYPDTLNKMCLKKDLINTVFSQFFSMLVLKCERFDKQIINPLLKNDLDSFNPIFTFHLVSRR